jgi:hypothetical protein
MSQATWKFVHNLGPVGLPYLMATRGLPYLHVPLMSHVRFIINTHTVLAVYTSPLGCNLQCVTPCSQTYLLIKYRFSGICIVAYLHVVFKPTTKTTSRSNQAAEVRSITYVIILILLPDNNVSDQLMANDIS